VLRQYFVAPDEIHRILQRLRQEYEEEGVTSDEFEPPMLSSLNFSRLLVDKSRPDWIGNTLGELRLRNRFGVTVVAIERNGRSRLSPEPDVELTRDDILVLVGEPEALRSVRQLSEDA